MPEISRFYGIVITMYHETGRHQHPHFHARYGNNRASFSIRSLERLAGNLPKRHLNLVTAWALQHQDELLTNWDLVTQEKPPRRIKELHLREAMEEYQIPSAEIIDTEFYEVIGFELLNEYKIRIIFNDHTTRVIDFEPILYGPMFGPLRAFALFRQVRLDHDLGTLVWPTGADIDPTVLHDWPDHVEAIIKRRRAQFAVAA